MSEEIYICGGLWGAARQNALVVFVKSLNARLMILQQLTVQHIHYTFFVSEN